MFTAGQGGQTKDIYCQRLSDITFGRVTSSSSTFSDGDSITYECDNGYKLVGNKQRTCQSNGQWSGNEAKCEGITLQPN